MHTNDMLDFLKTILIVLALFCPIMANSKVKFVEVTGRSVIEDNSPLLSKNSALEDALYLAALEGGAKISGYSIVDKFSNLKEEVIVRPASGILDYTIIDEIISDQHYEVTIRALVGKTEEKVGCSSRPKSRLVSFAPKMFVSQNSPAWSQNLPQLVFKEIQNGFLNFKDLEILNATDSNLEENNKKLELNNFDYKVLTGNVVYYQPADFSLETEIYVEPTQHLHSTSASSVQLEVQLEDHLKLTTKVVIKDIINGEEVFKTSRVALSYIGPRKTLFQSINVLSRPNRNNVVSSLVSSIKDLPEEINEFLKCISLKSIAQPSKIENGIKIDLGTNQGISIGNLALTESVDTPFAVFEVVKVESNGSVLLPLNATRNIEKYYGKSITFMEFYNEKL